MSLKIRLKMSDTKVLRLSNAVGHAGVNLCGSFAFVVSLLVYCIKDQHHSQVVYTLLIMGLFLCAVTGAKYVTLLKIMQRATAESIAQEVMER